MASIRRTDIMHKKIIKGRPAKSERERTNRRQEAYKWRDARRIYLASSFDRWRKLRSTLKLKDSSLAWHLMEAHEKGQCEGCRRTTRHSEGACTKMRQECDENDFLLSLIKSLRNLCYSHFQFDECEIVGGFCLEFDKKKKENFSVNELVQSGTGMRSVISSQNSQEEAGVSAITDSEEMNNLPSHLPGNKTPTHTVINDVACMRDPEILRNSCLEIHVSGNDNQDLGQVECSNQGVDTPHCLGPSSKEQNEICCLEKNVSPNGSNDLQVPKETSFRVDSVKVNDGEADTKGELIKEETTFRNPSDCPNSTVCSDSEPSFEIDVENMDTSLDFNSAGHNEDEHCKIEKPASSSSPEIETQSLLTEKCTQFSTSQDLNRTFSPKSSEDSCSMDLPSKQDVFNDTYDKTESDQCSTSEQIVVNIQSSDGTLVKQEPELQDRESPLDMSKKMDCKQEFDQDITLREKCSSEMKSAAKTSNEGHGSSCSKRKITSLSQNPQGGLSKAAKQRDDYFVSIPWQRRDMSRKEEYEFLEFNPFSDLAEFSQRYPHVHQRTYYRWKRRIKEEYIILEQCPEMNFQEFSGVVVQAKESVFLLWKRMIAQGKGFYAPSDSSKRLEVKSTLPNTNEYLTVQKNPSITYEVFCRHHSGVSVDTFNVYKRNAMQEFWLFYQNQHMNYKDFSKIISIGEDVFKAWKEYAEFLRSNGLPQNLNGVSNSASPNTRMSSTSLPSNCESSPSELLKDPSKSLFNLMNGQLSFNESLTASHASTLNPVLSDTVARSLSASYLASLQNMMFPWQSYYGIAASSLSQQVLPMMLWPGMMGLTGNMTNHMGLMPTSQTGTHPRTSPVPGMTAGLLGGLSTPGETSSTSKASSELTCSDSSEEMHGGMKMVTDSVDNNCSETTMHQDKERKLKTDVEKEEVDLSNTWNRSRKQNKQEYIYYLKNPELCFKELESLFPTISLRTFYRWRKEMNAAVLLLEDNKDMTFHQFQMVFPDIPEPIFESWKQGAVKDMSGHSDKDGQLSKLPELGMKDKVFLRVKPTEESPWINNNKDIIGDPCKNGIQVSSSVDPCTLQDVNHINQHNREAYVFVQKNPALDYATFSKQYPAVTVKDFCTWKKELKDTLESLRRNSDVDFETFKGKDSSISEDVFNTLKEQIQAEKTSVESLPQSSNENRKSTRPEFRFLLLNPYIELSLYSKKYPDVPKQTFYRWKTDIHTILNYMRSQPSVQLEDIAPFLPDVTQDVLNKWKGIMTLEAPASTHGKIDKDHIGGKVNTDVDEKTKTEMTEALLYLMHNPTIDCREFMETFDFVSANTFNLWLGRIKNVILHIISNPSIDFEAFSCSIKDVGEDIFNKWKSLSQDDIAAMDVQLEDLEGCYDEMNSDSRSHRKLLSIKEQRMQTAFEFCQKNPDISYVIFHSEFPTISENTFMDWMTEIREAMRFIEQNKDVSFEEASEMFPDISRDVYNIWKEHQAQTDSLHFLQQPSGVNDVSMIKNLASFKDEDFTGNEVLTKQYSFVKQTRRLQETYKRSKTSDDTSESSFSRLNKLIDFNAQETENRDHSLSHQTTCTEGTSHSPDGTMKREISPSADNFLNLPASTGNCHTPSKRSAHEMLTGISPCLSERNSLSALMAMSSNSHTQHTKHHISASPLDSQRWSSPKGSVKDEEEAYSSQRQKKMSRAEYLYVKENPDVDSQEFSRIFPGVSARTFYRWKKEIRAQLQLA